MFENLVNEFTKTFIKDNRWKMFLTGLENTLIITLGAMVIGVIIGVVIAVVKYLSMQQDSTRKKSWHSVLLLIFEKLFTVYVAIMRGTPMAIQLMIMSFIILSNVSNKILVAAIAFGLNSGAYLSEDIRAGILSVDKGQMEAGRSLGFNRLRTMQLIIMPQALKNILPALCNEGIALLKETSICGLIAVMDLTRASDLVRSRTYSAFFPLISVAIIYFIITWFLTKGIGILEKRLAQSDRN